MISNERLKGIVSTLCGMVEEFSGQAYDSVELIKEKCMLTDEECVELFHSDEEV